MRRGFRGFSSFLAGALVGIVLLVVLSALSGSRALDERPAAGTPGESARGAPSPPPAESARGAPSPPPASPASSIDRPTGHDAARKLVADGRLREAQEAYLELLFQSPGDREAMAGLIAVRRRMAGNDPAVLRRQAEAYREAIARGAETEEHYTVEAMKILLQAALLAADEVEGRARGSGPPPRPAATSTPVARVERPAPVQPPSPPAVRARPPRTPRPTRRPVATPAPAPPSPRSTPTPPPPAITPAVTPAPPPLDVNDPFFIVQVGPIADGARASEIAAELTLDGYAARVSRPAGGSGYFITLGPYRRSVADTIVKTIRARYGAGVSITVTPAP